MGKTIKRPAVVRYRLMLLLDSEVIMLLCTVERSSPVVECRTLNRESPGSNPLCYRFEDWAFFVHFTDAPVHSAV